MCRRPKRSRTTKQQMNWKDKVEKYQTRMTSQSADDMICRRIWKGLGLQGAYTSQRMGEIEKVVMGQADYKELDIYRIINLVTTCVQRMGKEWPWVCETLEITGREDVQGRIDPHNTEANKPWPLFLVRCKHETEVGAWALFPKDRIGTFFTPPYSVIKGDPECDIVIQPLVDFISQFGPFNTLFEGF